MLLILFVILLDVTLGQNQCGLSPDGQQTECVPLRECVYFNDNVSIMTRRIYLKMLKNSHCGFDIIGPKVCCPHPTSNIVETSKTTVFSYDSPPRIQLTQTIQPPLETRPPLFTQPPSVTQPLFVTQAPLETQSSLVTQPPLETQPLLVTQPPLVAQPLFVTQPPLETQPSLVTQFPSVTQPPLETEPPRVTQEQPTSVAPNFQTLPTTRGQILVTQTPSVPQTPPVTQTSVPPTTITSSNQNEDTPPSIDGLSAVNLLPTTCGEIESDRIFNGNKTRLIEFPWMAILSYRDRNNLTEFSCGGSVINERYILTAAHCIASLPTDRVLIGVRLGEHTLTTNPDCSGPDNTDCNYYQDIGIESVIPHPNFNLTSMRYDIGLIRLARPYNNSTNNIFPICLPLSAVHLNKNISNETMKITGWGLTADDVRSQELLQADLPIISSAECRLRFNTNITISSSQICAGSNVSRACLGDSGGPLIDNEVVDEVQRYVQHGVISFGPRRCDLNRPVPGIFVRVSYYMNWILNQIRE